MNLAPRLKKNLLIILSTLTLLVVLFLAWVLMLDRDLKERVDGQWFLPPVEIYSAATQIKIGQNLSSTDLTQRLLQMGLRQREPHLRILEGDFTVWDRDQCQAHLPIELTAEADHCLVFYLPPSKVRSAETRLQLVAFSPEKTVQQLFGGQPLVVREKIDLEPHLFAQFYGGEPILRRLVHIGEIPLFCLQAVTAIEDSEFLEHHGVSPTGLLRALAKNLLKGRYAQGGSTITQQLIKVYFLTSKKTLKRKVTELVMAVLLEARIEKDKILTNYLNAIYMGQNGPFQVVGFGAAAQHYYRQPLENLDLAQCALLASIVNSPGRFNPFTRPENALARRKKVLDRMVELNMVNADLAANAEKTPLPNRPPRTLSDPAPYFVQAVEREMEALGISSEGGLRIFTTLDERSQEQAQQAVAQQLEKLENDFKSLATNKAQGKELQAALISVDVSSGDIIALVGGRSFKRTQFNRAVDGHRQVGSIMKPFVYLTALESRTPEGDTYNPLTPIKDETFTHKYEGQSWSPVNYEKKFLGTIPMFTGLKNSVNAATARLGLDVGLEAIVDVARRAGIQSTISPLPSMTLGSFELYPMEVAQSYLTLARLGNYKPLAKIRRIENLKGESIYQVDSVSELRFAPENAAVLVGMMKQTVLAGTARSLAWRGFDYPAGGKTGTTSDSKDAWFAGFTPDLLTVVWLGYDDNTSHGLTGASGALPIWAEYMKVAATRFPKRDFDWPEGTVVFPFSVQEYNLMLTEPEELTIKEFPLVFRSGEQPGF